MQKSKFIESILLGIPIPSIFVSQRPDGVWDVVDGVQRLSTVLEFIGVYKDADGSKQPPSVLESTEYLPALDGMMWDNPEDPGRSFPEPLRIDFRRQKLDLKIVKKESDENTKYDLFERLNTLGTHLSDQEVRNCLLVMLNLPFYEWLTKLAQFPAFVQAISLTERLVNEKYDVELVLRFLVFLRAEEDQMRSIRDVGDYLTKAMKKLASDTAFDRDAANELFEGTFTALVDSLGEDCFRRTDRTLGRGGFLISVYEVLALGLGFALASKPRLKIDPSRVRKTVDKLWKNQTFQAYSESGRSASSRIPHLVPLGRKLFSTL